MHDTSGPATLHLQALINGMSVQVLIDGGNSDSFIQILVAKFLQLHVELAPNLRVTVANFETMTIEGCLKSVNVLIHGVSVTMPEVYVLLLQCFFYPFQAEQTIFDNFW